MGAALGIGVVEAVEAVTTAATEAAVVFGEEAATGAATVLTTTEESLGAAALAEATEVGVTTAELGEAAEAGVSAVEAVDAAEVVEGLELAEVGEGVEAAEVQAARVSAWTRAGQVLTVAGVVADADMLAEMGYSHYFCKEFFTDQFLPGAPFMNSNPDCIPPTHVTTPTPETTPSTSNEPAPVGGPLDRSAPTQLPIIADGQIPFSDTRVPTTTVQFEYPIIPIAALAVVGALVAVRT
jgi:hypothetical protein